MNTFIFNAFIILGLVIIAVFVLIGLYAFVDEIILMVVRLGEILFPAIVKDGA